MKIPNKNMSVWTFTWDVPPIPSLLTDSALHALRASAWAASSTSRAARSMSANCFDQVSSFGLSCKMHVLVSNSELCLENQFSVQNTDIISELVYLPCLAFARLQTNPSAAACHELSSVSDA